MQKHKTATGFFYTADKAGKVLSKFAVNKDDIITHDGATAHDVKDAAALESVKVTVDYREARAAEYPPIGDQLDAIMKWAFSETEIGMPDELRSLAAKCMSVKAKYPKPNGEKDLV